MRVMPLTTAPDTRRARLADLYDSGMSIRQVAVACGCSPKTAHRRLIAAGVTLRPAGGVKGRRPAREPLTAEEEQAAADVYSGGQPSLHKLGTDYGVSGDTMARRLRARGVEIRPRGRTAASRPPAGPPPDVLRLHHEGMPPRDIAAELGRSDPAEIARQLRAAGHTPHRGRRIPAGADLAAAFAEAGSIRALAHRYRVSEDRLRAALGEQRGAISPGRQAGPALRMSGAADGPAAPASPDKSSSPAGLMSRARVA
jgi:lambda repressor-like predicted transcriptional regulator